jgi:hypothetical protein
LGSLVGQDYAKLVLASTIVIGCIWFTVTAHLMPGKETLYYKLFDIGGWDALREAIRHLVHGK